MLVSVRGCYANALTSFINEDVPAINSFATELAGDGVTTLGRLEPRAGLPTRSRCCGGCTSGHIQEETVVSTPNPVDAVECGPGAGKHPSSPY